MVIPADVPLAARASGTPATDQRRRPAGGMLGRWAGRLISKRPALWPREAARPCPRPRASARAPSESEAHLILSRGAPRERPRTSSSTGPYGGPSSRSLCCRCGVGKKILYTTYPGERSTPGKTNLNAAGHLFPTYSPPPVTISLILRFILQHHLWTPPRFNWPLCRGSAGTRCSPSGVHGHARPSQAA
jgi:hypothetical protein